MADQHGAHQTSEAYVVSLCEDFCKSPSAPVGYMISQKLDMSTLVCGTVNGCGTPVLNMSSRITNVTGNEAGIGGGVISGVNIGMCKPVENFAPKVRAEGQFILRHDTIIEMNTAGPNGPGNVKGKIVYISRPPAAFADDRGAAEKKKPTKREKIATRKLKNGCEVDVYKVDGSGSGYGINPETGRGEILLGENQDYISEANENRHFEMDANDGTINGNQNDDAGNPLTRLEAEAESDRASIEAIDKKNSECSSTLSQILNAGVCWEYKGNTESGNLRALYSRRRKAMLEANEKIKQGDLEAAQKIADANPEAKNYIETAIADEMETCVSGRKLPSGSTELCIRGPGGI